MSLDRERLAKLLGDNRLSRRRTSAEPADRATLTPRASIDAEPHDHHRQPSKPPV